MINLSKNNFLICAVTPEDFGRYQMNKFHITRYFTEITSGVILMRIETPHQDEEQPEFDLCINKFLALDILKMLKKDTKIRFNPDFQKDQNLAEFIITGENTQMKVIGEIDEEKFVNTQVLIDKAKKEPYCTAFTLNVNVFSTVLKVLSRLGVSSVDVRMNKRNIENKADQEPILMLGRDNDHLPVDVLVMPLDKAIRSLED